MADLGIISPEVAQIWLGLFCEGRIPAAEVHRIVGQYMVAFLKTELERRPGYQNILTPGYALTREPDVEFFVTEKRNSKSIKDEWPDNFIYFLHQPGSEQAKAEKNPKIKPPVPRLSFRY